MHSETGRQRSRRLGCFWVGSRGGFPTREKTRVSEQSPTAPAVLICTAPGKGEAHTDRGTGRLAKYRLRARLLQRLLRRRRQVSSRRPGSTDKVAGLGPRRTARALSIWRGSRCASKGSRSPAVLPRRRKSRRWWQTAQDVRTLQGGRGRRVDESRQPVLHSLLGEPDGALQSRSGEAVDRRRDPDADAGRFMQAEGYGRARCCVGRRSDRRSLRLARRLVEELDGHLCAFRRCSDWLYAVCLRNVRTTAASAFRLIRTLLFVPRNATVAQLQEAGCARRCEYTRFRYPKYTRSDSSKIPHSLSKNPVVDKKSACLGIFTGRAYRDAAAPRSRAGAGRGMWRFPA